MLDFWPAIAYVGDLSLPCSDFPLVYVLELRRQFSDYGLLFILLQILRRKNRKVYLDSSKIDRPTLLHDL
jgi:hypothetical protein